MPAASSTPAPPASDAQAHHARCAARHLAAELSSTSVHTALAVSAAPTAKRTQLFISASGLLRGKAERFGKEDARPPRRLSAVPALKEKRG